MKKILLFILFVYVITFPTYAKTCIDFFNTYSIKKDIIPLESQFYDINQTYKIYKETKYHDMIVNLLNKKREKVWDVKFFWFALKLVNKMDSIILKYKDKENIFSVLVELKYLLMEQMFDIVNKQNKCLIDDLLYNS